MVYLSFIQANLEIKKNGAFVLYKQLKIYLCTQQSAGKHQLINCFQRKN